MKKRNVGSTVDSWLHAEGLYKEVSSTALKRVADRRGEATPRQRDAPESE